MSIEVLKQALAALKEYGSHFPYCTQYPTYTRPELEPPCGCGFDMATATLRKAIEQAEKQEPVAWVHLHEWKSGEFWPDDCFAPIDCTGMTPLYTAPPQREWVGLTNDEIEKEHYFPFDYRRFARAIEAKLKEKNHAS